MDKEVPRFPVHPRPDTCNIAPQSTFVTRDEPTWTRHHQAESTVYLRAESCSSVF